MAFLTTLLVSWGLATLLSSCAGWTTPPPSSKLPPVAIAQSIVLQSWSLGSVFWLLLGTILAFTAITTSAPLTSVFYGLPALAILAPLPYFIVDVARRDARLKTRRIVFFNPFPEVGTTFTRTIEGGETRDIAHPIALYIEAGDWKSIDVADSSHRRHFDANFKAAPNIYIAEGDNEFLHIFDSLALWKFVIHPGNTKAMRAFTKAMEHQSAAPTTPSLPTTPAAAPTVTKKTTSKTSKPAPASAPSPSTSDDSDDLPLERPESASASNTGDTNDASDTGAAGETAETSDADEKDYWNPEESENVESAPESSPVSEPPESKLDALVTPKPVKTRRARPLSLKRKSGNERNVLPPPE